MGRYIELTANADGDVKILINTDHIISIAPNHFEGMTKIMVIGAMFEVREGYNSVKALLMPEKQH